MKKIFKKFRKLFVLLSIMYVSLNSVFADVVTEVGSGGNIANSTLGIGIMNILKDITGTLQWVIPIAGVGVISWDVFKIMTGDEQDQIRYKKNIVKVLVCIVIGLISVTIVNLIAKYFGK